MCRSTIVASLDEGSVDDFAVGSSPTTATTPPCGAVLANTAWRIASPPRSIPGPLPYHMPRMPSYVQSSSVTASWLPITARRGQFLVDPRLVDDRQVGHGARGPVDLFAEHADRRALVAAHERGGVQAVSAVDPDLVDRRAVRSPGRRRGTPAVLGRYRSASSYGRGELPVPRAGVDAHDSSLCRAPHTCSSPTRRCRRPPLR